MELISIWKEQIIIKKIQTQKIKITKQQINLYKIQKRKKKTEEPEIIDPYANYKKITWADNYVETTSGDIVKVEDNYIYINGRRVLTNIKAKKVEVYYKSVVVGEENGIPVLNILTTDG